MPLVRDRCICLRKVEYSETSQIVALFAREHGIIRLIAKGAHRRTKAGASKFDGGVDLLPIADLLKSDVRDAARELGIPDAIIDKAPSAGLWSGQTDEAEMGFSYAELERYLRNGAEGVAPALAMRIERLIRQSEHKRSLAPGPGDNS